jgi:hypothetical protein
MSVQYTPGQLRNAVGIPPETYRHWKKALAPLRRDRGHSPCFTPGDLLAVAVVRVLSVDMAMRVGSLTQIAETLFELCNSAPWPILERGKLIFDFSNSQVQFRPELAGNLNERPVAIVPLRHIIAHLRDHLLAVGKPDTQGTLRFPPTAVVSGAAANPRGDRP